MLPLLAARPPEDAFADLLPWIVALLGLVVVGAIVIAIARRSLRDGGPAPGGGFTLHDLRQLRAAGELTEEEFARARDRLIGIARSEAAPDGPGEGREPPDQDPDLRGEEAR